MARTKNRLKRNSILNFVTVVILTILGLILSFCSFKIPYTQYRYNGFFNSISLGLDLAGGVSFVYDCSLSADSNTDDLNSAIESTVARLTNVIGAKYSEAVVTRQGATKIRIEVPSVTDIEEIYNLIGTPMLLRMTTEEKVGATPEIVGTDIEKVFATVNQETGEYGVTVRFNSEGTRKFANLTKTVSGKTDGQNYIYVYFGDIDNSADLRLTCNETINNGSTFISGSFDTWEQAENYALRLMSGTFNVALKPLESTVVSATLGAEALKLALIGGLVGLILVMLLLWWRYGDFGLLAALGLVIYIIFMLFFLQAISFVQLTLPGLAGIILSIGMAVDGTVIIFERVREEYRSGKKLPLSVKGGFKRAFWPIFDSNITTIFTAIILYILGTASIQGFAITLLIGIVLSLVMNLVVLRFFVKWYLPLNSINGKKLHLPKQTRQFKLDEAVVGGQDGKI